MSIKISFMHYMKWTRVMLLGFSEESELVCILLLFFSFHYHFQLVKVRAGIIGLSLLQQYLL